MPQEIERKFLVDTNHPDYKALLQTPPTPITQGYISTNAGATVRVRLYEQSAVLTLKGKTKGLSRDEFEYPIPLEDAQNMVATMCGKTIRKTRYHHPLANGLKIEVDVFHDFDLVIAEIEIPTETTPFDKPDWLLEDVSHDPQYFNSNLLSRVPEIQP